MPSVSVKKPGVRRRTPATRIIAPWASGSVGSLQVGRSDAPEAGEFRQALRPHQPRTDDRGEDDDPERRPEADQAADLDEERDLDDRDREEYEKKPHGLSPFRCVAVDLTGSSPYICAALPRYQPVRPIVRFR